MHGPKLSDVVNQESSITPFTLKNFFSREYLDTPLYHIRAPYRNERIVLPDPPPSASDAPMDKIKPPKNFTLSQESMNAALDAFRAGRSMGEATQEVAQVISSRSAGRPAAPALAPSLASRPSSKGPHSRASKPSGCNKPRAASRPPAASQSRQSSVLTSSELAVTREQRGVVLPTGAEVTLATTDAPPKSAEAVPTEGVVSRDGGAVALASEVAPAVEEEAGPTGGVISKGEVRSGSASAASRPQEATVGDVVAPRGVASKRALPSDAPAAAPAPKRGHYSSVPGKRCRRDTEGASTREQVAFRSRTRGELGDIIREMLLMVTGLFMEVDARDQSLRDSVDHRIEEARLEENLAATSDVRGNLAAVREHAKSL
ncbi:transcriptional regulatory protein AlgP-like [Manihot esculenta]|uniref:transcriptional regulatory protein AlgP-like n=1 Tax=Manihot esculenta TaxID=3983 RepID=UPI000B5D173A|nr:transcriptional regulatory protein AlgP-like [Manihot esculenta]